MFHHTVVPSDSIQAVWVGCRESAIGGMACVTRAQPLSKPHEEWHALVAYSESEPAVALEVPWLFREIVEAKTINDTWMPCLIDDITLPSLQGMLMVTLEEAAVAQVFGTVARTVVLVSCCRIGWASLPEKIPK